MTWSQGMLREVLRDHRRSARKSYYPDAQCVCGWAGPRAQHVDHVAEKLAEVLVASQEPVVCICRPRHRDNDPICQWRPPEVFTTDGTREGPLAHFTLNADGTWTQHVDMNPGVIGCPHKEMYINDDGVVICATCDRGARA